MARQNRCEVFDPKEISIMHCINRAVRRAMLCGFDQHTGQDYEHRRDWVKDRLVFLASQYGVDVLGYAIMGNHLHVILRNRPDIVETWSDQEVARRIWFLFPKRKNQDGSAAEPRETELNMLMASKKALQEYRTRLSDISWLMRQLAEFIARKANAEDECTGRFWEGRFKSQPLLDDAAILACSAYVDLNPIRASIAQTPEDSDFTSVQDRIESKKAEELASRTAKRSGKRRQRPKRQDDFLVPVYLNERQAAGPMVSDLPSRASDKGFLPIKVDDYLKLVDWTGRQIANGKRGRIPSSCKPILERLGLDRKVWCDLVKDFGRLFGRVAGRPESLAKSAEASGVAQRRSHGGAEMLAS
jgi:REP element-mobilizing transposase RayT